MKCQHTTIPSTDSAKIQQKGEESRVYIRGIRLSTRVIYLKRYVFSSFLFPRKILLTVYEMPKSFCGLLGLLELTGLSENKKQYTCSAHDFK